MALGILGGPSAIGTLGDFREEAQKSYDEEAWKEGQVSEASLYPWLKTSVETKTQQQILNDFLNTKGYATITADGKLGPGTCAAMKLAASIGGGHLAPFGTCQSFGTPPKCIKAPCKPTTTSPVAVNVPAPVSAPAYVPLAPAKPKMSTANMLATAGLIGGVAIAGFYVAKKKGWVK